MKAAVFLVLLHVANVKISSGRTNGFISHSPIILTIHLQEALIWCTNNTVIEMLSVDNTENVNSETCSMISKEGTEKTSNHDELQYLKLIQNILDNGTRKEDRTGKLLN